MRLVEQRSGRKMSHRFPRIISRSAQTIRFMCLVRLYRVLMQLRVLMKTEMQALSTVGSAGRKVWPSIATETSTWRRRCGVGVAWYEVRLMDQMQSSAWRECTWLELG